MLRAVVNAARAPVTAARANAAGAWTRSYAAAADSDELDVVVIGGGPGGYVAAIKAGQLGLKTACVESRGALGGTCLNVGCIPSKALLNASHHYETSQHWLPQYGINVGKTTIDVPKMIEAKDKTVKGLTDGIAGLFKKNKVDNVQGFGRITGPNEVHVTLNDGGERTLKAKNIVIATGSDVMPLPGIEIDEERIVSSTGALDLQKVPKKMAVIGGGVIGLELGSVWSRLGAEVTVVEFLGEIGAGMDKEVAKTVQRTLKKQGLKFKMSTKVTAAERKGKGVQMTLEPAKGGDAEKMDVDVVLVSIGRRPFTTGLGLEDVGVAVDERGFVVIDDEFRTNVPSIFAIGDAVRGPMLAHKAEAEGHVLAELLAGHFGEVPYHAIPSVIYTHPEVAWVGKTEQELKEEGVEYKVGKFPTMANSRARANGETDGMFKVITDAKTDRMLGVHIVNSAAGEAIAEYTLGLTFGASSEDIWRTVHAHPTLSEQGKEACMAASDEPIHI